MTCLPVPLRAGACVVLLSAALLIASSRAFGIGGGVSGLNIASILTAFIGAVILLAIIRAVQRA